MANLFQGSPQAATSYSSSTSQSPQWMQDAVYNQVQMARNVAAAPFSAPAPQAAPLSAQQKQAIKDKPFGEAIERIKKGELGLYQKMLDSFDLTAKQVEELETTFAESNIAA